MSTPADGIDLRREQRALDLLARAVALPPRDRDRFFDAECGADAALREEVASLA